MSCGRGLCTVSPGSIFNSSLRDLVCGCPGFKTGVVRGATNPVLHLESVHGIFQLLAGAELDNLGSGDLDGFPGTRIAAGTFLTLFHSKCAESGQGQLSVFGQKFLNLLKHGIDRAFGSSFRQVSFGSDLGDELSLGHLPSPSSKCNMPE